MYLQSNVHDEWSTQFLVIALFRWDHICTATCKSICPPFFLFLRKLYFSPTTLKKSRIWRGCVLQTNLMLTKASCSRKRNRITVHLAGVSEFTLQPHRIFRMSKTTSLWSCPLRVQCTVINPVSNPRICLSK